jgi:hypothetical protein
MRKRLGDEEGRILPAAPSSVVLQRGDHVVAVNLGDTPAPAPLDTGEIVLEARPGDGADPSVIPAHGGWVAVLPE